MYFDFTARMRLFEELDRTLAELGDLDEHCLHFFVLEFVPLDMVLIGVGVENIIALFGRRSSLFISENQVDPILDVG